MAKYLKTDGNYTIKTGDPGRITLDPGATGTVEVSGNLKVLGTTTTIESTISTINDNILVLNAGETSGTVSLNSAGIQIDRTISDGSSGNDVYWAYHDDTADPINGRGLWRARHDGGDFVGIATNHINTSGTDLTLINDNSGVVSVGTSSQYENRVTSANHMPNKKYVDDAITTAFATVLLPQIGDGILTPSSVVVSDFETSGADSQITFKIDDVIVAQVFADGWEFDKVRITDTVIETMSTGDDDLTLKAWGDGSVRIDDVLSINKKATGYTPSAPSDGLRLYVGDEYTGKSGLFFVNESQTRDELVSKNRALLFGMLF